MDRFKTLIEVFFVFLRLGLTSFGGPVAHLGYFRQECVVRRKWLDERVFADLVSLCQALPGPASSQVGMGIGFLRAGFPGAIAAWTGFTIPSAVVMAAFGLWSSSLVSGGWLHGLKIIAAAVVGQAVVQMGQGLCPDNPRRTIVLAAAVLLTAFPNTGCQVAVMFLGGVCGGLFLRPSLTQPQEFNKTGQRKSTALMSLTLFFLLLFLSSWAVGTLKIYSVDLFGSFYRTGALVFGGGHVVLPLLQAQVVPTGWVSNDVFLAGYGLAQAVPGPLFTLAAYLGAVSSQTPSGWIGAAIALTAIFLPSFLLVVGVLPFWDDWRRLPWVQRVMPGINASVVGILLAAWLGPVLAGSVSGVRDVCAVFVVWGMLYLSRNIPWAVVPLVIMTTLIYQMIGG